MPPDLALLSTLIGSNYPCLELIFMVPKVFEPLKFDCRQLYMAIISNPKGIFAKSCAALNGIIPIQSTTKIRLPFY